MPQPPTRWSRKLEATTRPKRRETLLAAMRRRSGPEQTPKMTDAARAREIVRERAKERLSVSEPPEMGVFEVLSAINAIGLRAS